MDTEPWQETLESFLDAFPSFQDGFSPSSRKEQDDDNDEQQQSSTTTFIKPDSNNKNRNKTRITSSNNTTWQGRPIPSTLDYLSER